MMEPDLEGRVGCRAFPPARFLTTPPNIEHVNCSVGALRHAGFRATRPHLVFTIFIILPTGNFVFIASKAGVT